MTSAMRLQADGPVHVSLNISCRHRGHHIAAKQKAHLPLVSAGFALRLGSALDGATKPLLLIALHERSVLCLTCSDARSEEFCAVSTCNRDDVHHKLRTQQAIMSREQAEPCKMHICACSNLNSRPACMQMARASIGSADHASEPQRTLT